MSEEVHQPDDHNSIQNMPPGLSFLKPVINQQDTAVFVSLAFCRHELVMEGLSFTHQWYKTMSRGWSIFCLRHFFLVVVFLF